MITNQWKNEIIKLYILWNKQYYIFKLCFMIFHICIFFWTDMSKIVDSRWRSRKSFKKKTTDLFRLRHIENFTSLTTLFFVELSKTNEVKFWLTIYSYFDVSMIMVIIIKKNKYLKSEMYIWKLFSNVHQKEKYFQMYWRSCKCATVAFAWY